MNNIQILKAQKTKLLNKKCVTQEEFEEVQEKLNQIEIEIMLKKGGE
jgi:ribosomal protein L9